MTIYIDIYKVEGSGPYLSPCTNMSFRVDELRNACNVALATAPATSSDEQPSQHVLLRQLSVLALFCLL